MAIKKKAPPAEKENGERWLVSYSDFVTLLLGVFIIMYSMMAAKVDEGGGDSNAVAQEFISSLAGAFGNSIIEMSSGTSVIDIHSGGEYLTEGQIEEITMEKIEEEINNLTEEFQGQIDLDDSIEVIIDEIGIHIRIRDTVLFNSGKYEINKSAEPIMHRIGEILKKLPNNKIQIEGHTDDIPINTGVIKSNWELGSLRAVNVTKMFIEDCALNPKNVCAISYGEFQPIGNNQTIEGRAENRRVEITILRNYLNLEELL